MTSSVVLLMGNYGLGYINILGDGWFSEAMDNRLTMYWQNRKFQITSWW